MGPWTTARDDSEVQQASGRAANRKSQIANRKFLFFLALPITALAGDWPQWGGNSVRNMVSDEKDIPAQFDPGPWKPGASFDISAGQNIKWIARLGSDSSGNTTVAGGKVFVGTNNNPPRNPKYKGNRGVLACFEEATGKFLWQFTVPKYPQNASHNMDFESLGICSSPTVDGKRVYAVTNRCEVVCLDVNGLADGNDGPFKDEGFYFADPARQELNPAVEDNGKAAHVKPGTKRIFNVTPAAKPIELDPADADVIWHYDMMNELAIWPQDASDCSVLIHGDLLYTCTSNGVDRSHHNVPSPQAPTLIALNKNTGELVAEDDANLGTRILHGSWSYPSLGKVNNRELLFFGGPDGVCYAVDPVPAPRPGGGVGVLKKVWWYDCSPPKARFKTRAEARYPSPVSASEINSTPVLYKNRIYVAVGQDPRHGLDPAGCLSCIDATGTGDMTDKGRIWEYRAMHRSLSTVSIADGLLYIADLKGTVHCLDPETGKCYWTVETNGELWGSTFYVDGKVFVGNKTGFLWVLAAGKEPKILNKVDLHSPVLATPMVANGVLYVETNRYLFALQGKKGF